MIKWIAAFAAMIFASFAYPAETTYTHLKHFIASEDGTTICVEESGSSSGQPILFIHGFSQSKSCWSELLRSTALQQFRLLAMDLRGHGESDKPESDYSSHHLWADDLHAVIEKLELDDIILVCWSYGGLVCLDYIRDYGTEKLNGINLVSACTKYQIPMDVVLASQGESFKLADLAVDSFETASHAMLLFNHLITKDPMDTTQFHEFFAESLRVPQYVRYGMMDRDYTNDDLLPDLSLPILATYGRDDGVVRYENESLDLLSDLTYSLYDECGHSPFLEFPERFASELVAFVNPHSSSP